MSYEIVLYVIFWIIVGYLLGNVSFGYIIGKDKGIDIRDSGSGNTGTTNALRTMGIKAGLLTFLGDLMKAVIPVFLSGCCAAHFMKAGDDAVYIISLITGLAVTLGHNFPMWMHFKGGKGIAVTAGVTLAIAYDQWLYIVIALLLFVVIVIITKYVSVGSLCVPAWALPVYALIFKRDSRLFVLIMILSLLFTILAFVMHRENIKRLFMGTENKLFSKKPMEAHQNEN